MRLKPLPSFILLLLFISAAAYGQRTVTGKIVNSKTLEPIAYANIGIEGSNVGTISNADGSFSLTIPNKLLSDTLVFSSLGFGQRTIPVASLALKTAITIYLPERAVSLKPVVVSSKKEKLQTFELGNSSFKGGVLEADTTYAGRSVSLLIENKAPNFHKNLQFPAFLEKARLRIFRNNLKTCRFRIRLNEVDSATGAPGKDLLQESIVVSFSEKNGWLAFDLSLLNIAVDKPFYVTFEQILDLADRTAIADDYRAFATKHPDKIKTDTVVIDGRKEVIQRFTGNGIDLAGTFIGIIPTKQVNDQYTCYVRETSLGEWKRVRGIVAATVTVSNQPLPSGQAILAADCPPGSATCHAEKLCKDFMDEYGVNGMQVCVSKNNKVVWNASLGYADLLNKKPVTDSTKFRINSISKSMSSVALLQLIAANKLNLDAPVQQYIPAYPTKAYPITTRQLAGHLAGFRDYNEADPGDYIRTVHYDNAMQALDVFKHDTLLFKPGERFHYSTFGWNLIGAVIEAASGEDYLSYMRKHLWQPLQLTHTCGDNVKESITNRSKFYDATGAENDLGDLSYKYAGGGLLSTAKDLNRFGNELLHGKLIAPSLKGLLFDTQHTLDKQPTGYGLGWYIGKDKNGHRIWHHAGDSFSGSSFILIYPDDDIVVTLLANSQAGVAFDIGQIGGLFYQ